MKRSTSGNRSGRTLAAVAAVAVWTLWAGSPAAGADTSTFVPVTAAMLTNPDPADWLSWRRTTNGHGYSPLDQITAENVGTMRLVWTRALREGPQSGTPLAYDGVLYMPNPADVTQAIDAATGGGLLFGGDLNGRFKAFDQGTGEVLWEINLGSPVTGFPISFAVDGRQYIAVSTGHSGISSMLLRLTRELRPSAGNNLFVFALPE